MIPIGDSGLLVTMRHVRRAGLCASGVRGWFARHDAAVYEQFRSEGLPVEWLEALDDAFAAQVAAAARQEAADGL